MSHNQTNKIHNPFEGEELEKGLLQNPLKLVKDSIKAMEKADKALAVADQEFKIAAGEASESASMLTLLSTRVGNVTMGLDGVTRNELRKIAKQQDRNMEKLKAMSKLINDLAQKSPFYTMLNVGVQLDMLDKKTKRRR
tara:strand:- start:2229 stop:2645 length:417 start_codon:yes stop_codon:yes gene_type:complete